MKQDTDMNRRQFLGKAAATAGLAIAPGVMLYEAQARPADQAATSKQRWGMLINTAKCEAGCDDCVTACKTENGWGSTETKSSPEQQAQWIRKVKLTDKQTGHVQSLPLMCQHCEKPPCVDVCPTGASMKRDDGIVLVDKHICIGCRYCMMACPYKARSFIHEPLENQKPHAPRGIGTVESCTMCVHRVDKDGTPACVESCNDKGHKAMYFGNLNDPGSEISLQLKKFGGEQIRADLGLNTGVRYQGL
ncbi:MAG: 4Fe-4S dicluster domain-containing protein [Gammaproteobacteria bacterium]|nr:4Fe-4S dicluster domain-containing protein [Gammaproteobacteria bacterium]MDH5777255.1 4Fe-4S dicluster domain-containing protein [Gammaproteobacteria bacterium]